MFNSKYWNMIYQISVAEFRSKDQGTFLGFLWTLFHPLIYFIVLYNLFSKWMGSHIPDFPLYLIIGIVQWNFFATSTSNSINVIVRYNAFVKSIKFPKSILVLASVLSTLYSHILELIILIIFWLVIKANFTVMVFFLLPILLLNIYLIVAVSFMLATIGVYFLDINRIWGIFTNVGFFLTPIFYTLELINPTKRNIILLNPMTHIIKSTRDVLIDGKLFDLTGFVYVFIFATIVLIIGYQIFNKYEKHFVERI
ncbi:MAG: ABC transporter permease [Elusimicrobia bacterium]|nr:ABC transporter permease [Candidatus Liberimonas magnetica]